MIHRLAVTVAALATAATLAPLAGIAAADPESVTTTTRGEHPSTYDVGFRIGGYGFRREGDVTPVSGWTECRMNGLGVFADRALRGPIYVEAGLDAYASSSFIEASPSTDVPIDRMSGLISVAVGVRTQLAPWLRGYAQLGAGAELTRVSVPYGMGDVIRDDKALPMGFLGVGADVRVARGTYVGMTMRMLVMANFDYDPARLMDSNQWVTTPTASQIFTTSPDLAAQGQFYIRRDL